MSKIESEFGKGFLYPLALFLAHAEGLRSNIERYKKISSDEAGGSSMWLYGAADHLFEFDPEAAPTVQLRTRCKALQKEALGKRLPMGNEERASKDDCQRLIDEAKAIFLEVDKFNGTEALEAEWK